MLQNCKCPKTLPTKQQTYIIDYIKSHSRVLDIGCASGGVDKALKDKGCSVVGVEINSDIAREAEKFCDTIIMGDIEAQVTLNKISEKFDYILFIDVLEHLKWPDRTLLAMKRFLNEQGLIIAHMPSISFWATRLTLLKGKFKYNPVGGIFDIGHLRFFNYYTMKELFFKSGYRIEIIKPWTWFPKEGFISNIPFFNRYFIKILERIKGKYLNLFGYAFTFVIRPEK